MLDSRYLIEFSESSIELEKIYSHLACRSHGGQTLFLGVVREFNQNKKVTAVSYDCFVPLAKKVFNEICNEVIQKCGPDVRIVLWHRIGKLNVGESSVAVGVSTPHRGEAFSAARYSIDEIKTRAPIWKKEHYENGETDWLQGHSLCHR